MKDQELEVARFQLALKRVLESKTQLLSYMRTSIFQDTLALAEKIPDREVKKYLRME